MDPDACFSELLSAIADGDGDEAVQHAENLLTWPDRDGFAPGGGKIRSHYVGGYHHPRYGGRCIDLVAAMTV